MNERDGEELIWPALFYAARDLLHPRILVHALWPPFLALFAWLLIAWFVWQPAATILSGWLSDRSSELWYARLEWGLVQFLLLFAFLPLVYLTTLFFLGAIALPRMMREIAAREYADLERYGSSSAALFGSLANGLGSALLYLLAWLLCLPLFLIPGAVLIVPLLLTAWLNTRTFAFDALAEHASPAERKTILKRQRGAFFLAGLVGALVAFVPILNLLAPAFTALSFVHLGLTALRRARREKGGIL